MKTALITGITGQDGSYLADLLLEKEYKVYGLVRRLSSPNFERISHILNKVTLIQADVLDQNSLITALQEAQPDEVYNLAAQSFVQASFDQPILTSDIDAMGVLRLLEAIRAIKPGAGTFPPRIGRPMRRSLPASRGEVSRMVTGCPGAVEACVALGRFPTGAAGRA